jgi:hypothetical protein
MAAKRAAIEAARASSGAKNPAALTHWIPPSECTDRIRIVFDDSGSMNWQYENAKKGVVEFLRNCVPNQTSVAIHFMNNSTTAFDLTSNLPAMSELLSTLPFADGGTPFFNTLMEALEAKPRLTRLVAFTDGSPTDRLQAEGYWDAASTWTQNADIIIKICKSESPTIPIDTVYFGGEREREMNLLKYLSAQTGGFFLHFDPAKVSFASAFKYLAPVNRLMLTSGSFRASLENGGVK